MIQDIQQLYNPIKNTKDPFSKPAVLRLTMTENQ